MQIPSLGALARFLSRIREDRRGVTAITLALTLPVLIGAVGGAIDYSRYLTCATQLQDAVDAASVGSVATNSPGFIAGQTMPGNGPIAAGVTNATAIFNRNAANVSITSNVVLSINVNKLNGYINSSITATGSYSPIFLGIFRVTSLPLSVTASAQNGMPPYLDFYLLLDVSGSMGLPSTSDGQTVLAKINPDNLSQYPTGCTLACHMSGSQGYALSRHYGESAPGVPHNNVTPVSFCAQAGTAACIQLRLDAVGYAVQQLVTTAQATQKYTHQFRIGLYPFIRYAYEYNALTYTDNTSGMATLNAAAANLPTLLDTGVNANLGSGGTHFENALPTAQTIITTYGIGAGTSVTSRQPWMFLVTDGSQDSQTYWNGSWSGSNHATTLNSALCTTLKAAGIRIAVLYIPYQTITNPNSSFAGDEDGYANSNIPNIPPALQACASPGFYFTANAPTDITAAMNTMFNAAVATNHIIN
jgi:Flp pilus assembly protein TadG